MHEECFVKVVKFENGTYFSGVKERYVRTTKLFYNAKFFNKLSERDAQYLSNYRLEWIVIDVKLSIDEIV